MRRTRLPGPHKDHGLLLSLLIPSPILPVGYLFIRFLIPDLFLGSVFGAAVMGAVVTIYYIGRGRL